mmetsp:Transcript_14081/g.38714  ORF Transcript_14081/g.38714 Transcript_14081/m.38714 type:complete len:217 (-) Transcript_14081:867-1517(-)
MDTRPNNTRKHKHTAQWFHLVAVRIAISSRTSVPRHVLLSLSLSLCASPHDAPTLIALPWKSQALQRTNNLPSMPKKWPQQSLKAKNVSLQIGPERDVMFLSEALGIKLNRGPDGVVRVIDVSPDVPGSPIARKGKIEVGDIIREAGGVDLRRPITNMMWGDTVALIKMAPRPIVLTVAAELNSIVERRREAAVQALSPSQAQQMYPNAGDPFGEF